MDAADRQIRQQINAIFDPNGETKDLANRLGLLLLEADPDRAYSALIVVGALLSVKCGDEEVEKDNALRLAKKLGEHIAEEVEENYDDLLTVHRKYQASLPPQ